MQTAFSVKLPVGEEAETSEALHLEADFAVGLLVGVELENVEASHSEDVAERSGDAEVEDVELCSEAASVGGLLEGVKAVDVETLYFGDAVGLLVAVEVDEVGGVEASCSGDAVDHHEDAEVEEGAVRLPGDAEIEEGAVKVLGDAEVGEDGMGLLVDVEFEVVAALQPEASAMENLVVVEATQAFELAFGSPGCSPDLDSAFFLQDSYSLLDQEREPMLEMGLETDGAADCQRVRDCDRAATVEVLEDDAAARLLRADFDYSQEVGWVFQHLELGAELALLVGEVLLHQVDECYLALAGHWG